MDFRLKWPDRCMNDTEEEEDESSPAFVQLDQSHEDNLWLPNIEIQQLLELKSVETLKNSQGKTFTPYPSTILNTKHLLGIKVFRDGTIETFGRYQVSLNCDMDFSRFPFDKQYCVFPMYMGENKGFEAMKSKGQHRLLTADSTSDKVDMEWESTIEATSLNEEMYVPNWDLTMEKEPNFVYMDFKVDLNL